MGRQSARIYFQGKDHKEIYFNGHYHDQMYLVGSDGKASLVWEKIRETESMYDVYGLVHTQGLYFALAVLKAEERYYDRVFLLVGESLKSMKVVNRNKYYADTYTYNVLAGCFYMGYTDNEIYIIWGSNIKADIFEISAQAAVKNMLEQSISSPMPKRGMTSNDVYPSMGAVHTSRGVIAFDFSQNNRVYLRHTNGTTMGTELAGGEERGLVLLDDGYVYFRMRKQRVLYNDDIKMTYQNDAWTYDAGQIPNVFARTNAEERGSIEEIYISDINDIFREYITKWIIKAGKPDFSWEKTATITLEYEMSCPIKTGAHTVMVLMRISGDGFMEYNIDFEKNAVVSKYNVDADSMSYVPQGMLHAVKAGNSYIFWNTYRYSKASLFRYDSEQHRLEHLSPEGITEGAPFIMCSYGSMEEVEFMNANRDNGNVNKLFRYNIKSKVTEVETIKVFAK